MPAPIFPIVPPTFPEGCPPHFLDPMLAEFASDATIPLRRVGDSIVGSAPGAGINDLVFIGCVEGFEPDITRPVEGRVAHMIRIGCELRRENAVTASDKYRSELGIADAQVKASAKAIGKIAGIADEAAEFEARVARNEAEHYAHTPLDPTHAAEAVMDSSIVQRVSAMPTADYMRLMRENKRACLAVLRDPIAKRDARYNAAEAAWRDHRRAEDPRASHEIDTAVKRVEWQKRAIRAALRFAAQSVSGGNGAALAAVLPAAPGGALDSFCRHFGVERGTGKLTVRDAA